MDIKTTIQKSGLDKKQTAIYIAALELGEASMTDLAKKANLKRPTAYLAVEELQLLGLLSETQKGKRKIYSPVHPRRLLQMAKLRARNIEELLPEMVAIYNTPKDKPKIQVFEGETGMKQLYEDLYRSLSNRKEALWFTRIDTFSNFFSSAVTLYKKILRQLTNPKIRELNFGNEAGEKWLKEIRPFRGKNHQIRLLSPRFEFGFTDSLIFGNKLVIFSFKKDAFVIVIESEEIAKTYRAMFEWVWLQGK